MPVQNILFVMADQLRADYLSCTGHPTLTTPNIDALAARGVRFAGAYVQAPVCGILADKETYSNECEARRAGAMILAVGRVSEATLVRGLFP